MSIDPSPGHKKLTRLQMVQQVVPGATRSGYSSRHWSGKIKRWDVYVCLLPAADGRGWSCKLWASAKLDFYAVGATPAEAFANARSRAFALSEVISDLQEVLMGPAVQEPNA